MTTFAEALDAVVTGLTDAGLSASTDPADVNPPGVVVKPDDVTTGAGKLCGTETLRLSLVLVVTDAPTRAATVDLARLAARVGPAARGAGLHLTTDPATFERAVMPDDPTGLPCLRISATATYPTTPPTTGRSTP